MGNLMRRYWHPVAANSQLRNEPVKAVTILGESLVLYRDARGRVGMIGDRCPHRGTPMRFGVPEREGLRCAAHGWLYDSSGYCLETPAEPEAYRDENPVPIKAYRVQELGGLVFAYLGLEPPPILPTYASGSSLVIWG